MCLLEPFPAQYRCPMTPPTDGLLAQVTLAQLRARIPGLSVLVAPEPTTAFRWVTVSELDDPAPFLTGGELLLTAGLAVAGDAEKTQLYVQRLKDAGVAGLGFGVAPVHADVPEELVASCQKLKLPLFRIAESHSFVEVTKTFAEILELERLTVVKALIDANKHLLRAALSVRPEQELLAVLGQRLSTWCALITPDHRLSALSFTQGSEAALPALPTEAELLGRVTALLAEYPNRDVISGPPDAHGTATVVYRLRSSGGTSLGSFALARTDTWGPIEQGILSSGVGLFELLVGQRAVGSLAPSQLATILLTSTAGREQFSAEGDRSRRLIAESIASGDDSEVRVVLGVSAAGSDRLTDEEETRQLLQWRVAFHTKLVAATPEGIVAISAPAIDPDVLTQMSADGWHLVVGRAVPLTELSQAHTEVLELRDAALARREAVLVDDLSRGIGALFSDEAGAVFAESVLAPLLELPQPRRDTLIGALRGWLANNGNWDASARDLGAHRNSVRRQIAAVAEILGANLNDPDLRAQLWIALRYVRPSRGRPPGSSAASSFDQSE
jgi:purine catabolism regulator